MAGLQSSLYTVALALCVFSTGILGNRRARAQQPLTFFIGYLGIESLGFAFELLVAHPAVPFKALWLGLLMVSSLFVAPALWLAIEETLTGRRPRLRDLHPTHSWVIVLGVVLCLPLITTAHSGIGWDAPTTGPRPWHFYWIHEAMIGCIAIFSLQVPYYLKRSRRLMLAHFEATSPATLPQRAWLHLLLLVVGTTWTLGMLRVVQCASHAPTEFVLLFAFIDVSVTVGALYLILRREFVPATTAPMVATPAKYARSPLPAAHVARIRQKLTAAFRERQLHHDSLLSLDTLSRAVGEKPHYVSQVINHDLEDTYFDLVNRHRIEDAQRLLRDEPNQTVLEIAFAVGFNAKSTFNTAFRRQTGMTPREYRAKTSG